jgi:hypothetical protein
VYVQREAIVNCDVLLNPMVSQSKLQEILTRGLVLGIKLYFV